MFTGIVEEVGTVLSVTGDPQGMVLELEAPLASQGTRLGDSIAVNGVCLTVTRLQQARVSFGVAPETLRRTNLGALAPGQGVNLERALAAQGRLGGHFVQGHVDGTGRVTAKTPDGTSLRVRVAAPPEILRYLVEKGFITVDGVSLTLTEVGAADLGFMLVDYTQHHTTLAQLPLGAVVNLEIDILAKYAERFLSPLRDQ
ncbi:MAG: riboflavin synthase [Deltaproteobacteria bacterium]|nr:riboflavin synthase [Deltaproteobacteria bacterium]